MQRSPELVRVAQPVTGQQRSLALGIVAFSAVIFMAAVPFAKTPLAPVPPFIPIYATALIACDVITAALLFAQFNYLRSRALLILAAGYLFTALITIAHSLSFPGLFAPSGLLGAGPQTTAWLYMFWHGTFPLAVIAYARLRDRRGDKVRANGWMAVTLASLAALVLAVLFTLVATAGRESLPAIMSGNRYTPAMIAVVGSVWLASAVALLALWRRRPHCALDVWLMVVMTAWIFDIGLAAVFNEGRFDLGFYAGRIYGLIAASVVLGILLAENSKMYLRLAQASEAREIERLRLVEANRQLEQARLAAQGAEQAKGAFLATMSHEIRTPMNGILGMLELLSLMKLEGEQRTTLEIVRESGRSLLRIIDDILDFSRIEAGKLELRPEPTSVAGVLQRVCHIYSGNASAKGLNLEHRMDARIGESLMVDPLRLQQILNNLVSNAIKFTDHGHVSLRASLIERIDGGQVVRFVVEDSGAGIADGDRARLFEPFAQVGKRTTGGTGLGLSISRRLAELMGGTLAMESAVGIGTRVLLTLQMPVAGEPQPAPIEPVKEAPRAEAPVPGEVIVPTAAAARMSRTLVLVVDDHPVNRMLLVKQLAKLGYAADSAGDGVEAIGKLSMGGIGAIVTDCNMPEMDGYELARNIRAREARNGSVRVPIIACTANALAGEATNCFAAGMDDYLAKPVSLDQLRQKLSQWLPLDGPPAALPPGAPIEVAALAEITGGDPTAEREVLAQFLHYGREDAESLRIAIASRELDGIVRYAHRMKGAGSAIGAARLSAACGRVEASGKRGEWAAILAGMEEFEHELGELESHIAGLEA